MRQAATRTNVGDRDGRLAGDAHIEDGLDAEVLYAGGGNVVVLFATEPAAMDFTRRLSCRGLAEAPGLQLVIAGETFDWAEPLVNRLDAAFVRLGEAKRARAWPAPLLGLGVTAMCASTGLPAVGMTEPVGRDPAYPASAEILAKVEVARRHGDTPSAADRRLQAHVPLSDDYAYPTDFAHLGATPGEYSHIAVVHADGNGMGRRLQTIRDEFPLAAQNRAYIDALRAFSTGVQAAATAALQRSLAALIAGIAPGGDRLVYPRAGTPLVRIDLVSAPGGGHYLPFRPIVFGGDDLTFVCDGRLGLALAVLYLRAFEEETGSRSGCRGTITARAGVAIVKSHYPFARAYALAGELAASAGQYRRDAGLDGSALDWHFALSGVAGSLAAIRDREYQVSSGCLSLRPLTLGSNLKHDLRAWPVVETGITAFQGREWAGRRNQLNALRDALRFGPAAVEHVCDKFNEGQPVPPDVAPNLGGLAAQGWYAGQCGYFDAIELADWFVPLQET